MIVAVALFELHIEYAQSLKEKRMVVKSLRDKLAHHFKVATNEVALHDVHHQSRLAISFITLEHAQADAMLDKIIDFIESNTDARLSGWTTEKLEFDPMAGL